MAKSSKKKRPAAGGAATAKGKVKRPAANAEKAPVRAGKKSKPRLKATAVARQAATLESALLTELPGEIDRLARLLVAIAAVGAGTQKSPRTHKLLASGVPKMAQKLIEEAAETAIDAVRGERTGFINESADLLFNLVVLWSALRVTPGDVWAEMDRRERLFGMAEKLPKPGEGGSS